MGAQVTFLKKGQSRDLVIFRCKHLENGLRYRLLLTVLSRPTNYPLIGNGLWRIEWWRHRWRHVTAKGQGHDPNIFKARYFENGEIETWVQWGTRPIGNGTRGIESSRDRWRHVTRQMPCWFHNPVFEYSFNTRTRVIRDSKAICSGSLYTVDGCSCWLQNCSCMVQKIANVAILKIPGNSRGNFWIVKFPGIPGNSRTGIPGGLVSSLQ